ncbi:GYD domain-containing protein [Luteitalea sp. TBR-22]|uniref:GYD domain-containing protein n=1 Tax=Luteitalea sp. TBR-22 TaxID=2802971 RepID=UPI001EF556D2|nr:GYD domain-containing protein [Luteitalea sp. TBR-22]
MAKYLTKAKYNAEGMKGLLKDGGTSRQAAVTKAVKALGGKVEAFYFAYGEADAYVIVDLPDPNAALALTLTINATGVVTTEMVPLVTPKDVDEAVATTVKYRAPGA